MNLISAGDNKLYGNMLISGSTHSYVADNQNSIQAPTNILSATAYNSIIALTSTYVSAPINNIRATTYNNLIGAYNVLSGTTYNNFIAPHTQINGGSLTINGPCNLTNPILASFTSTNVGPAASGGILNTASLFAASETHLARLKPNAIMRSGGTTIIGIVPYGATQTGIDITGYSFRFGNFDFGSDIWYLLQ